MKKKILARWQLYLLLLLPLLYIIIFAYVPMGGLIIAFKQYDFRKGILGSPWVGLKHFKDFFKSYKFVMVLKNTLTLSLYSLAISFPLPILFALLVKLHEEPEIRKSDPDSHLYPTFLLDCYHGWPSDPDFKQSYRYLRNLIYHVNRSEWPQYFSQRSSI